MRLRGLPNIKQVQLRADVKFRQVDPLAAPGGKNRGVGEDLYPPPVVKPRVVRLRTLQPFANPGKDITSKTVAEAFIADGFGCRRLLIRSYDRQYTGYAIDGQGRLGAVEFEFRG